MITALIPALLGKSVLMQSIRKYGLIFLFPILLVGGGYFGVKYALASYENLKLENQRLSLQIQTLQKDIQELKQVNEANKKELETVKSSYDNSISELKSLYDKREISFQKQLQILKSKKQKEKAVDDSTITVNGVQRPLTEQEKDLRYSEIRIDALQDAFQNTTDVKDSK